MGLFGIGKRKDNMDFYVNSRKNLLQDLANDDYQRCVTSLTSGRQVRRDGSLGRKLNREEQGHCTGFIKGWNALQKKLLAEQARKEAMESRERNYRMRRY